MHLIYKRMKIRQKDSFFFFAIGFLFCVLIAFFKEDIFPEKYFFDSLTIQRLIEKPYRNQGDKSFSNAAEFYRILHIDKVILAPVTSSMLYLMAIIIIFKRYKVNVISFSKFILIVVYSAIAMVYLSTYSKDFVLFFIVVIPFIIFEKKSLLIWTFFALFYAYFFRTYWFIIIPLFWIIKLFVVKSPKLLSVFIPCYYVMISFVYNYIFGTSLYMVRYLSNLDRDAATAQTEIATYVKGTNFMIESINYIVTLLFLILPIPLLLLGTPFYIILTILIVLFFYNFVKLYFRQYNNERYTNIFALIIAFMLVQSLFEPDYGSFVRHLSPFYPIMFLFVAKNTNWKSNNKGVILIEK